jgi:hypothetical protein
MALRRGRIAPAVIWLALAVTGLVLPGVGPALFAQSQPAASAPDPAALPARDSHQRFLIAADPYLSSERSQQKFGKKHPYGAGVLAVDVYLRNDGDSPVKVTFDTIELRLRTPGGERLRLEALDALGAADAIVAPHGPNLQGRRSPLPGSSPVKKNKEVQKMAQSLESLILPGDVVAPHATVHGFVFFDLGGHFDWLDRSVLYVPDVNRIPSQEKLFYFEIDLAPALR